MTDKPSRIPSFTSVADEAAFWDTHDAGDFIDELEITKGIYIPENEEKETLSIRIPVSLKVGVKKIASRYHISISDLIRLWMMEKMQNKPATS